MALFIPCNKSFIDQPRSVKILTGYWPHSIYFSCVLGHKSMKKEFGQHPAPVLTLHMVTRPDLVFS